MIVLKTNIINQNPVKTYDLKFKNQTLPQTHPAPPVVRNPKKIHIKILKAPEYSYLYKHLTSIR